MKEIKLTQGKVTQVDDDVFDYLNQFNWYAEKGYNTYYAARKITINGLKTSTRMHTVILKIDKGSICDHIDHDGLNNQKSNLRICSHFQNMRNRKSNHNAKSRYLGVSPSGRNNLPWRTFIEINRKSTSLGYFKTEEEAALAYNNTAIKHYKEFANLNILEPSF